MSFRKKRREKFVKKSKSIDIEDKKRYNVSNLTISVLYQKGGF